MVPSARASAALLLLVVVSSEVRGREEEKRFFFFFFRFRSQARSQHLSLSPPPPPNSLVPAQSTADGVLRTPLGHRRGPGLPLECLNERRGELGGGDAAIILWIEEISIFDFQLLMQREEKR